MMPTDEFTVWTSGLLLEMIYDLPGDIVPLLLVAFGYGWAKSIAKNDSGDDRAFASVKESG
jgi:hypothetical protein